MTRRRLIEYNIVADTEYKDTAKMNPAQQTTSDDETKISEMMREATAARHRAYCPYSRFRVGAAVLCEDDTIITGCNVENASYGLSVCAERVAIMAAVSKGQQKFKAMAVCCDIKGEFAASCGACRQFIAEFCTDLPIYLVKPDGDWKKISLTHIFPMAFSPASLEQERVQN